MASPPMNARKPDPPSGNDAEEEWKKRERAAVAARQRKCRAKKAKEAAEAAATRASTPAQAPALAYASTPARSSSSNVMLEQIFHYAASANESNSESLRAVVASAAQVFESAVKAADDHSKRQAEIQASALKAYVDDMARAPPTTQPSHRHAFSSPSCESGDTTESE